MKEAKSETAVQPEDGPVFSVRDGVIDFADPAAEALGLHSGKRLSELLPQLELPAPEGGGAKTVLLLDRQVWSLQSAVEDGALRCVLRPQSAELPGPNESTLLHAAGSIRTALQDLQGALNRLSEGLGPSEEAALRETALALRSVYRLRRTAGELELFSTLRMGRYQPCGEKLGVCARLAAFCGETREQLRAGGFELSWVLPRREFSLCLDWPLLAFLLRELLANAAANSADGRLRLELSRVGRIGLRFAVINRQTGALPAPLFHRHAELDTLLEGGLGLGLSTVSAGAAVHGGGLLLSRTEDGTVTAVLSVAALPSDEHSVGSPVQLPDGSDAALEAFSTVLPPEAFRPEELL